MFNSITELFDYLDDARLVRTYEDTNEVFVWFGGLTVKILAADTGDVVDAFELPYHDLPSQERDQLLDVPTVSEAICRHRANTHDDVARRQIEALARIRANRAAHAGAIRVTDPVDADWDAFEQLGIEEFDGASKLFRRAYRNRLEYAIAGRDQ